MVSRYVVVIVVALAGGCAGTCGESHEVDGGTDDRCPSEGFVDLAFHVPGGEDVEFCEPLGALPGAPPGIRVARSPEADCIGDGADAVAGTVASVAAHLSAGGAWFERESPIDGGLITNVNSNEPTYCPDGGPSHCGYTAHCPARVTHAGSMTGDFVGAELTEPCALVRVDRGLPEGLVVTRLRLWGPLVTFSTGDSGVMCP